MTTIFATSPYLANLKLVVLPSDQCLRNVGLIKVSVGHCLPKIFPVQLPFCWNIQIYINVSGTLTYFSAATVSISIQQN